MKKHNNLFVNGKKLALLAMLMMSLNTNAQTNQVAEPKGNLAEKIVLLSLTFGSVGALLFVQAKDADKERLKQFKQRQK